MLADPKPPKPTEPPAPIPAKVLLVGVTPEQRDALAERLGRAAETLEARDGEEALEILAAPGGGVSAVVTGESLGRAAAYHLVAEATGAGPGATPAFLVLAGGGDLSQFQELIDRDRLFFLSHRPPSAADVADLVRAVVRGPGPQRDVLDARPGPGGAEAMPPPPALQAIGGLARRVALQEDPDRAEEVLAEGLRDLLVADRVSCLFYDSAQDLLWAGTEGAPGARRESAAVGLASFTLRAGRTVRVGSASADPRWNRELDDPEGDGDEALLAVPVQTSRGRVLGVLVAVRDDGAKRPFRDGEVLTAEWLAEHLVSAFAGLVLGGCEGAGDGLEQGVGPGAASLYRRTALEDHVAGGGDRGDVLRLSPPWTRWSYRLLVGIVAGTAALGAFARVPEYAGGPAVVRVAGPRTLSAVAAGTVSEVAVAPGQPVEAGEVLVRLEGARELAELQRIERELDLRIPEGRQEPGDLAAAETLAALRAQREEAAAAFRRRSVVAPADGVVGDVRVRRGERVKAGQDVLTFSRQSSVATVLAFLPGRYRPFLEPGLPLRFELAGFPGAHHGLTIESVGGEIVGPSAARRRLGPELADAVSLAGPVVLVEARLPAATFEVGRRSFELHDGMLGRADVRVRSEPLLFTVAPQLKGALTPDGA